MKISFQPRQPPSLKADACCLRSDSAPNETIATIQMMTMMTKMIDTIKKCLRRGRLKWKLSRTHHYCNMYFSEEKVHLEGRAQVRKKRRRMKLETWAFSGHDSNSLRRSRQRGNLLILMTRHPPLNPIITRCMNQFGEVTAIPHTAVQPADSSNLISRLT